MLGIKMSDSEHKKQCFKIALSHLEWFQDKGRKLLESRVTDNEACAHYLIPQTKQAITVWKHPTTSTAKKFEACQTAGKVMAYVFWNAEVILIKYVPWSTTTPTNA